MLDKQLQLEALDRNMKSLSRMNMKSNKQSAKAFFYNIIIWTNPDLFAIQDGFFGRPLCSLMDINQLKKIFTKYKLTYDKQVPKSRIQQFIEKHNIKGATDIILKCGIGTRNFNDLEESFSFETPLE